MPDATVNEQQILEALHGVPPQHWPQVLDFIHHLPHGSAEPADVAALAETIWTADQLQRLPRSVQDAVLRQQAARLGHRQQASDATVWWSVREIGRLPPEQRGILLEASAALAAKEYEEDAELTAFDAYREDDLYVDSSDTQTR